MPEVTNLFTRVVDSNGWQQHICKLKLKVLWKFDRIVMNVFPAYSAILKNVKYFLNWLDRVHYFLGYEKQKIALTKARLNAINAI